MIVVGSWEHSHTLAHSQAHCAPARALFLACRVRVRGAAAEPAGTRMRRQQVRKCASAVCARAVDAERGLEGARVLRGARRGRHRLLLPRLSRTGACASTPSPIPHTSAVAATTVRYLGTECRIARVSVRVSCHRSRTTALRSVSRRARTRTRTSCRSPCRCTPRPTLCLRQQRRRRLARSSTSSSACSRTRAGAGDAHSTGCARASAPCGRAGWTPAARSSRTTRSRLTSCAVGAFTVYVHHYSYRYTY